MFTKCSASHFSCLYIYIYFFLVSLLWVKCDRPARCRHAVSTVCSGCRVYGSGTCWVRSCPSSARTCGSRDCLQNTRTSWSCCAANEATFTSGPTLPPRPSRALTFSRRAELNDLMVTGLLGTPALPQRDTLHQSEVNESLQSLCEAACCAVAAQKPFLLPSQPRYLARAPPGWHRSKPEFTWTPTWIKYCLSSVSLDCFPLVGSLGNSFWPNWLKKNIVSAVAHWAAVCTIFFVWRSMRSCMTTIWFFFC